MSTKPAKTLMGLVTRDVIDKVSINIVNFLNISTTEK